MRRAVILLSVVALVAGCETKWTIAQFVGDINAVRTIEGARVVQMWRLTEKSIDVQPTANDSENSSRDLFLKLRLQHQSVGEGVRLDRVQVETLKDLLLSVPSYLRGRFPKETDFASKMCGFSPVVRIRLDDGRSATEVWICFFCSDLVFMNEINVTGSEDFSPMSPKLLALVKSVLKDDPVIAKLAAR